MKDIGELLKKEREKKKLTIKEVAVVTKINSAILIAIEEGDEQGLPPKPFLRGFVQSYARHLDVDVDKIMQMFMADLGTTKPQITKLESNPANDNNTLDFINQKWDLIKKGSVVAGILLLLGFAWFLVETINKYEEESKQAAERKETVITQVSTNTVNTEPSQSPNPNLVVAPPVESPEAKPSPQPTDKPVAPTATSVPTTPLPKPTPSPVQVAAAPQQVIIEALDNVRVKYNIDNGSAKSVDLKPEQILTIKGQTKVTLTISDGGAVNIIYNGRDTGVPGNLGQAIDLSFPK